MMRTSLGDYKKKLSTDYTDYPDFFLFFKKGQKKGPGNLFTPQISKREKGKRKKTIANPSSL